MNLLDLAQQANLRSLLVETKSVAELLDIIAEAGDALEVSVVVRKAATEQGLRADRDYTALSKVLGSAQEALRELLAMRRASQQPENNG